MKVLIVMEGGLIQEITTDTEGTKVLVLDNDVEIAADDENLFSLNRYGERDIVEKRVFSLGIQEPECAPEYVNHYFNQFTKKGE